MSITTLNPTTQGVPKTYTFFPMFPNVEEEVLCETRSPLLESVLVIIHVILWRFKNNMDASFWLYLTKHLDNFLLYMV